MKRVAVIGATGAVGRQMVNDLAASSLPIENLDLYASPRSEGQEIEFRGKSLKVKAYSPEKLHGTKFVLMSAGGKFSKEASPQLVAQESMVIDNSSAWRMVSGIPLIVPEVNGDELKKINKPTIIANPNCSTIQLVVSLQPIHQMFKLQMVQVATYQSVSGTGQQGIAELKKQMMAWSNGQDAAPEVYARRIAFNVIPAIAEFDQAGHCFEEEKMVVETRKIMRLQTLDVLATTARVPTLNCHAEAVTVQTQLTMTRESALQAFKGANGIVLQEEDRYDLLPTNLDAVGDGRVWVGRVRLPFEKSQSNWLQFWNVADNLKKGAATNAVQILEALWS